MSFPLLQHVELLPQIENGFLGSIFPPLSGVSAKPRSPHPVEYCVGVPSVVDRLPKPKYFFRTLQELLAS